MYFSDSYLYYFKNGLNKLSLCKVNQKRLLEIVPVLSQSQLTQPKLNLSTYGLYSAIQKRTSGIIRIEPIKYGYMPTRHGQKMDFPLYRAFQIEQQKGYYKSTLYGFR